MTLVAVLARLFVEVKYGGQRLVRGRIGLAGELASRVIDLGSLRHLGSLRPFASSGSSLLSWNAWEPYGSLD